MIERNERTNEEETNFHSQFAFRFQKREPVSRESRAVLPHAYSSGHNKIWGRVDFYEIVTSREKPYFSSLRIEKTRLLSLKCHGILSNKRPPLSSRTPTHLHSRLEFTLVLWRKKQDNSIDRSSVSLSLSLERNFYAFSKNFSNNGRDRLIFPVITKSSSWTAAKLSRSGESWRFGRLRKAGTGRWKLSIRPDISRKVQPADADRPSWILPRSPRT